MNTALKAFAVLGGLFGLMPAATAAPPAPPPQLFGTVEFRAESLAALPQWQRTLRQIEQERSTYEACSEAAASCPSRGAMAWQAMLKGQVGRAPLEQLQAINRCLNDWRYKADAQNYGQRDHWGDPARVPAPVGDCEDYAITKYVSSSAGLPGRAPAPRGGPRRPTDLAHAVLAVYLDDHIFILDNLTQAVLPQEEVTQYVPYYSINETTRWAHVPPAETLVSAASGRASPSVGSR